MTEIKARVFLILTQKGGVGKTTTTINLAAAYSIMGYKVLVIDWDPQANATSAVFEESIPMEKTIYNLIDPSIKGGDVPNYKDLIKTYQKGKVKFDVLPSGENLALAEFALPAQTGREFYFKNRILSKIEGYDIVLVDCQPSLGILVVNALCSSSDNELIVCVRPDKYSRGSIGFLFNSISSLNESLQVMPKDFKILITHLLETQKSDRFNLLQLEKDFPQNLLETTISKDTKLSGACDSYSDIFNFAPETQAAIEYMKVAKEILGVK